MPVVSRSMTITEAEFLRLLAKAIAPLPFSLGKNVATVAIGAGAVRIAFHGAPQQPLGSLMLPMTQVDIWFDDVDETTASRFLDRFDRAFHRGGG